MALVPDKRAVHPDERDPLLGDGLLTLRERDDRKIPGHRGPGCDGERGAETGRTFHIFGRSEAPCRGVDPS